MDQELENKSRAHSACKDFVWHLINYRTFQGLSFLIYEVKMLTIITNTSSLENICNVDNLKMTNKGTSDGNYFSACFRLKSSSQSKFFK